MYAIALKMLMGDRVKYLGLIFGIAFATLLMTQQVSIFIGLLSWGANPVLDVREAQVWVMDQRVRQADEGLAISDAELYRVRSVDGVEWAVPYFRGTTTVKTRDGRVNALTLIGVDNASLVGLPPANRAAAAEAIRGRNALVLDETLVGRIWNDDRNPVGEVVEINDNRVTIAALTNALPTFAGLPVGYMKYTDAITITPPERNKLSFVLVQAHDGVAPAELARRIEKRTGLKALTREQFARAGVDFIVKNTGIPASFGIAIGLGVVVGIVITALTLAMFVAENLRSFGALKAIGVTHGQLVGMVLVQALLVGITGFGLGIGGTAAFLAGAESDPNLDGFLMHWQVIVGALVAIIGIVVASALLSLRRVLKMDAAVVFRG